MSRSARAALLSIVVLLSLVPPVGAAQRPGQSHDFKRIPLRGPEGQRIDPHLMPRLADPGRLTVMVQMQGAPVAVRQGKAQRRGQELSQRQRAAVRRNLRARQNRITDDIADLGGDVVSKVQDAYNGVKVNIRASKIARLADLANVRAVREVQKFRPSNAQSVPFLGTPGVWEDLGLTGRNVKVGIIDTGIDYEHANFGGPGTVEAFENNDSTVIEPGSFPTAKVVGGYDFVGDDYDASSDDPAALTPQPDPDPLDCNGHGSHVGGTAGGLGVLADGSTYDGPYDESTHDNEFRVGPGVAPEADLYALRVFGCEGSTDVTVEAIDWAVENDLDVINMSLGSSFGRANDPSAAASDNAAKAGVVVVASAGNSGPGNYITGSPATATRAISVAASDSNPTLPIADLAIEGGETLTLQNSNGANVAEPITGELVVLEDDPATEIDESLGCEPESFGEAGGGDIVVTRRGICPRVDRATIGQDLGVAAVVFINDADGVPPVEGPIPGVEIPFLGATPEQGEVLIAANGETATITDAGTIDNPTFRLLASFTSNGPRMGDSFAKPDITGPGVAITSTLVGSGNEPVAISGTSMSSPHVAGVAALHREAHPRWRVEQTKAALVNTGEPQEILDYSTIRAGSGQVDPRAAVRTPVVATGEPGTASVSFGFRENRRRVDQTRPVKLTNHGRRAATFIARVDADADTDGAAHVSVSQRRITVPGHSSRTVHVRLYANLRNVATGFTPASGNVVFRPVRPVVRGSGLSGLRVPYVAVPRAVSRVETTPDNVRRRPGPDVVRLRRGQDELNFTTRNRSAVPGTADVYAWGLRDERGHLGPTDVNAVGVQAFPEEGVGVFAINTRRNVSNPSVNEWDVLLDNDDDGVPDFGVIGFDIGAILLGGFNGQLGSFTIDLETGEIVSAFFADGGGAFNTSVVLLPFLLEDVGLAPDGQTDFEYISAVFSLEGFPDDIVTGSSRFDAYSQQVETGDFFQLDSFDRIRWSADLHQRRMRESHIRGFMVVNPGSRSGYRQATLVRVLPR